MKKKVSLKDIAERVGVSIALVSYVLNGKKQDRISKTVAQNIRDMAAQLNYRTNHIARSLKTKKTFTIGLVVADISNAFSSTLARIIEDEAEKFQYTVIFGSSDENAHRSQKLLDVLVNHQVDGLIIAPAENSELQLRELQESGVPFVLIDRYFDELEASYISINNYEASYGLVQHLIDNGHLRIGIISYSTSLINLQERKRGYMTCLADNGFPVSVDRVKDVSLNFTKEEVETAVNEMISLPEPVDAILFASNTLCVHGLKYINTLNVRVPSDLSIVAFDESDAADLFYAPLTHVKQPLKEMGELAVKTLMKYIEQDTSIVKLHLEAELVIRQSSAGKL